FVGFAPFDKPRYACAVIVEHGGWGATVAAPMCRDTLTYLFDKGKAMAALAALEEQWGGTLAERMKRRADAWRPSAPPPRPVEKPRPAAVTQNPRLPPAKAT
ncbi:MAG: penicillin-binding protein 2, partial [Sphingomonadales bacterium]|nr:penicillin-binding protein 2 [Sphingomonadales bacterium]